jgi:hypothetical protein
VPVKFLIASSVLKITESGKTNWKEKEEGSIVTILKILHFNIMSLDDARDLL